MNFIPTTLNGSFIIHTPHNADKRGHFSRMFCMNEFKSIGHTKPWVQCNHSHTINKGTIRGMHFQKTPFKEIKLIKCTRGKVFDIIVDIRQESPTFLNWFGEILSEENGNAMYVPEGFAHGFQTLTDNCDLIYFHTEFYNKEAESGLRYNDPALELVWPEKINLVSDRDSNHQLLNSSFNGIL